MAGAWGGGLEEGGGGHLGGGLNHLPVGIPELVQPVRRAETCGPGADDDDPRVVSELGRRVGLRSERRSRVHERVD